MKKFEREFAEFSHTQYAVGVSNGLDAIVLALKALSIGVGDEVIVPSNTYIATVIAVSQVGATPIFAEPDDQHFNITAQSIANRITEKTKAIIPVHLYGLACPMDEIMAIAEQNKLFVIEDNAQSQGATFRGTITGSWGNINATSFYPGKNIGALGDAGMVTTNDSNLNTSVRMLRNYGSSVKYYNEVLGYNMRLDELQAGILSLKLPFLSNWTSERNTIAERYKRGLEGCGDLSFQTINPGSTHVYHVFIVRTQKRDELMKHLAAKGVGCLIHYPVPPHLQKAYQSLGFKKGDFPIAELISKTCLSLPLWPGMTEEEINYVIETVKLFF